MLISIKRVYLNSGLEVEILLNTNYMIKVEHTSNEDCLTNPDDYSDMVSKPKTRIVMDGIERPSVIYTNETIPQIKAKLTKARNNK